AAMDLSEGVSSGMTSRLRIPVTQPRFGGALYSLPFPFQHPRALVQRDCPPAAIGGSRSLNLRIGIKSRSRGTPSFPRRVERARRVVRGEYWQQADADRRFAAGDVAQDHPTRASSPPAIG